MDQDTLYLLDGHHHLYRAYHAIPELSNSRGIPTNAVYGFAQMLVKILQDKAPDYLGVVFDSEGPTERHLAYEGYKAQRPPMPDPLVVQIPYVRRLVEAFRIEVIIQDGIEADDLIGTMARKAEAQGMEVTIVSGDRDLLQLVSPRVRVFDSMHNRIFGVREVVAEYGVPPNQVVEVRGLSGDSSDNLPGVPGVGPKTARQLIQEYGTIDRLLAHLDSIRKPKLRENLQKFSDQARLSRDLARLRLDVPGVRDPARLKRVPPDVEALTRLYRELEFSRLLKDLHQEGGPAVVDRKSARAILPRELLQGARRSRVLGVAAIFPDPSPGKQALLAGRQARLVGMGLSCGAGRTLYHEFTPQMQSVFRELLEDPRVRKVGHDLKTLIQVLSQAGIRLEGEIFDTRVASYLLTPHQRTHDLTSLSLQYLGRSVEIRHDAPKSDLENSAREMAEAVLEISQSQDQQLGERQQTALFREVEMPLVAVLANMEQIGVRIDKDQLETLSEELEAQLEARKSKINRLAHGEFNLNSPKQLSEVLFGRLGLRPVKRTKTGYSTDEEVLTQLALEHELPSEILVYRQAAKLKSTYVDALPAMLRADTGRIHTTYHQSITATGRLSSSDPNLQNIPIRGEWGQRIRRAFIPEEGFQLLSADYNQIELRLLAHLSGDAHLIRSFQKKADIHTATAANIFKLSPDQITPEMRRAAKTVNFGVIYGMGAYSLAMELGITQSEAREYIAQYFGNYPGVREFIKQTVEEAQEQGYVSTILGRRRAVPELASRAAATRKMGERIAFNTVIQGSAADLIKQAMIRIFRALADARLKSRMLLQIHDELVFEVSRDETDLVQEMVALQMEGVMALSVPVRVELGLGESWAEIH